MTLSKLTASTAALLLSSTALLAQETQSQSFQAVFIDVGGTAVLVPADVALEACGFDQASLQSVVEARLQESGVEQTQFSAQTEAALSMTVQGDAAGMEMTETAMADASSAAGQDTMATETGIGEIQNVESTAADTVGDVGAMGAANSDPFVLLAACQIDVNRATEFQVDMTQSGAGLGFDADTLGIQPGTVNQ